MREVVIVKLKDDGLERRAAMVDPDQIIAVEPGESVYPVVRKGVAGSVEDLVSVRLKGCWSFSMTLADFRDAFPELADVRIGDAP